MENSDKEPKEKPRCLYCGAEATNKEHVPSRTLMERPYPDNLFTFNCCDPCNKSFSLDEEYFLNILAALSLSETMLKRTSPGGNIFRARQRSNKLYRRIIESLIELDGRTYLQPETKRLTRIIEKYAFGLYFFRYKRVSALHLFKCIGFHPYHSEETRPPEVILLTHSERFRPKTWIHLQPNVFSYIVVRDWRYENKLTMILHLHNTAWCVVAIPYPKRKKTNPNQLNIFR